MNEFDHWLYEVCNIRSQILKGKTPHDIISLIEMTDAKLAFLEGISSSEYAEQM